ncbi:MAG: putative rane protein [Verrucomicrobiota bacterium]|jgi:putative membrane protein|nr:putative rane protein [Verrucomicrobiota bacterium]MDK2962725.1 putative rane protein [Verrucomicrobiota bacterium]
MKEFLMLSLKGALMGAANVIPGVSGGTVALLTGIFEELILSIRAFDLNAVKMLFSGQFRAFSAYINLRFLLPVGTGILVSILSFARLLEYLFAHQALYVWSFFFGLILASVFFVLKKVRKMTASVAGLFAAGTAIAAVIAFLPPTAENASIPYLFLCGMVAICSMILPGLSGSYVLLLMGNYQLVMIDAVIHLRLGVLLPVTAGAIVGLIAFSRFLAWVFRRFHDGTVALLTGFIFGSLSILWPWKSENVQTFAAGGTIREKVIGYTYSRPEMNRETVIALVVMGIGVLLLALIEKTAVQQSPATEL